MYRNAQEIEDWVGGGASDCIYIVDDQTIQAHTPPDPGTDGNIYTFKLISDKYIFTSIQYDAPQPDVGNCISIEQTKLIPSRYDFMTPIYHEMAILSAILIIYLAYKLIIYPFFRRTV